MRSCGKLGPGYPPRQFPLVRRCITSVTPRLVRIRHIVGSKIQWQSAPKVQGETQGDVHAKQVAAKSTTKLRKRGCPVHGDHCPDRG